MCYPDDLHDRSESIGSINGSHFRHSEDDKDFLHREEASEALLAKITFSPWRGVLGTLGGSTSGLHARVSTCMRQHFGEFRRRKGFLSRTMANFPFFYLIDLSWLICTLMRWNEWILRWFMIIVICVVNCSKIHQRNLALELIRLCSPWGFSTKRVGNLAPKVHHPSWKNHPLSCASFPLIFT